MNYKIPISAISLILCNPPYSSHEEVCRLSKSVREYEPKIAIFSPHSPIYFYKILAEQFQIVLKNISSDFPLSFKLLLEIGHGQEEQVKALLSKSGLLLNGVLKDQNNLNRCLFYAN